MKTYSMDLRERVIAACDAGGGTHEQIAARFSVSVSWIRDLLKRRRATGSIAPRPRGAKVFGTAIGLAVFGCNSCLEGRGI
jgi:transposase